MTNEKINCEMEDMSTNNLRAFALGYDNIDPLNQKICRIKTVLTSYFSRREERK